MLGFKIDSHNLKYIIIGVVVWGLAVWAGWSFYRGATAEARQTVNEAHQNFITSGVSAARSLAQKNSTPLFIYRMLKKPGKCKFNLETPTLKKDQIRLVALVAVNDQIVACTDEHFVNDKLPQLKNSEPIHKSRNVSVEQGVLADNERIIGFFTQVSAPKGAKFDTVGDVYLALKPPTTPSMTPAPKLLLSAWIAGSFIGVACVLLWLFQKTPKAVPTSDPENLTGSFFDHYQVKRPIATGGMASVYLAVNKREKDGIQTHVVIKQILPKLIKDDPGYVKLFDREAQMAVQLQDHPNIVRILDYYRKQHAIVMQYIDGENLSVILKKMNRGLHVSMAIYIVSEIAKGLDYAHTKTDNETGLPLHIIHRDIKPGNILISYNGQVKIADFGIAKDIRDPEATLPEVGGEGTAILPTIIKGTPAYMSPEQAMQEPVDHRSDLYSLGLVFHEILTGKQVRQSVKGLGTTQAINIIVNEEIEPIDTLPEGVSKEINAIVMKCLEKDKNRRYQSARELHGHLKLLKKKLNILLGASDLAMFMKKHFKETDCPDSDQTIRDHKR